jgi:ATP phosphoribosyltransferase
VQVVLPLDFSKCRVSFAVPKNSTIQQASDLAGKRIATSYPNTVRKYLDKQGVRADIHTISGSVEIAPSLDLADAIADIVSTGNTLFQNNLREVFPFLQSEAVLIKGANFDPEKQPLLDQLVFRITSVLAAKDNKYILLNAPVDQLETICAILPGMKSPTVLPLAVEGWVSVHSVVKQKDTWNIVQQLKEVGAQGILVVPIEKMVN